MRTAWKLLPVLFLAWLAVAIHAATPVWAQWPFSGDAIRGWLADRLAAWLSTDQIKVEFDGVTGALTSGLRVATIRLSDRAGTWLTVNDAVLDIIGRELLRRRVVVEQLGAATLRLDRMPEIEPPPSSAPSSTGFSLPSLPFAVEIRRLNVDEIHVAPEIAGQPVTATLTGNAQLAGGRADAELRLRRTDDSPGYAAFVLHLDPPDALNLNVDVVEPTGRLLQRALDRGAPLPLAVSVQGSGPVDGWTGDFRADAGDLVHVEGTIGIARPDQLRVALDGRANVAAAAVPPGAAPLVRQPVEFATTLTFGPDAIGLEHLRVAADPVTARVDGRINTNDGTVAADVRLVAADLTPFASAVNAPLAGSAEVVVTVAGPLSSPVIRGAVSGHALRWMTIAIAELTADIDLGPAADRWQGRGHGTIVGLAVADAPAGLTLPDRLTLALNGSIARDLDTITIEHARLGGGGLELTATGRVADLHGTATATSTIELSAPDLSTVALFGPLPLRGSARLSADVTYAAPHGIEAKIRGATQQLATGMSVIDALLGAYPSLTAHAVHQPDGALVVSALELHAANASLTGDAWLSPDFSHIRAQAKLAVPTLAPLAHTLNGHMAGSIAAEASIDGALGAPAADGRLTANGIDLAGIRLDRLSADIKMANATRPAGTFQARFATGPFDGRLAARFDRPAPHTLSIQSLALTAPGTRIEGDARIAFGRPRVTGRLTGRIANLEPWSQMVGAPLAGKADLRVAFAGTARQRLDVTADATDIRIGSAGDALAMRSLRLTARLDDMFGRPTGHGTAEVLDAAEPSFRADGLHFDAKSTRPGTFAFSAAANGALSPRAEPMPFRIVVAGESALAADVQRLRLDRLDGNVGAHDLALREILTVVREPARLTVDGLSLGIGPGAIEGSAAVGARRIDIRLNAREIPLDLAGAFAATRGIAGRLAADLDLSGTADDPRGRFAVRVRDLRLEDGRTQVPPLSVDAESTLQNGRVDTNGTIGGLNGTAITLAASLPLRLEPATLTADVPRDAPIRVSLRGSGQLESWSDALPLGEDRIAGRFDLDAAIAGTLAHPAASGQLAVRDGHYVNFASGLELRTIDLALMGDGQRFVLQRLAATDGAQGQLAANGFLDLTASPAPHAEIAANFVNFLAVRRDDATVTADGTLQIVGTLDAPRLAGEIRIARAELRPPERLPPEVVNLDVVVVNSRTGTVGAAPTERDGAGMLLDLDLNVTAPGRVFIRGRGLDSEWRGNLAVTGTTQDPHIAGLLEVVRGDFSVLGETFRLERGTIRFLGGETVDPQIDVVATHQAAEITAQMEITGTVSNPSLRLTSVPEIPQDEILSRVLFGRRVSEITPLQGLQLAQAAAALAGRGPDIVGRIRSATGLDRLEITTETEQTEIGTERTTPIVRGGRYVAPGVYVGLEQGTRPGMTRTQVEIEITPNISVETSVGIDQTGGVGLNWRWDY
ncbi:MAG TPA: translocation/assembly module TamB domain-containing protein [Alphaproteobacteria bacterium]